MGDWLSPRPRSRNTDEDVKRERSRYDEGGREKEGYQGDNRHDSRSRDNGTVSRSRHGDDLRAEQSRRREEERRERHRYGYGERERERERNRDRARYDQGTRGREGSGGFDDGRSSRGQRRSASPRPRTARSRSRGSSVHSVSREKAKPNFKPSGLLAAETNTVQAADGTKTILKYNEPPEARKPPVGWRLYVFKGSEQNYYTFTDKQHAAIQYRSVQESKKFGATKAVIKPFIIDLESTNGTHVNDEVIPQARYYELKASDVLKFGQSTREYVLLHDEAA